MKIIDRIVEFIEYKDLSMRAFESSLKLSNGYISKQRKSNGSVGSDIIERIIKTYPELNPLWLVTGNESMIRNGRKTEEPNSEYRHASFDDLLESRITHIVEKQLKGIHRKLDSHPTLDDIRSEIIKILINRDKY